MLNFQNRSNFSSSRKSFAKEKMVFFLHFNAANLNVIVNRRCCLFLPSVPNARGRDFRVDPMQQELHLISMLERFREWLGQDSWDRWSPFSPVAANPSCASFSRSNSMLPRARPSRRSLWTRCSERTEQLCFESSLSADETRSIGTKYSTECSESQNLWEDEQKNMFFIKLLNFY